MTTLDDCFGIELVKEKGWNLSEWIYESLVQSGSHFDGYIEIDLIKHPTAIFSACVAVSRLTSPAFIYPVNKNMTKLAIIYPGQGMLAEEIVRDVYGKLSPQIPKDGSVLDTMYEMRRHLYLTEKIT
jgi:hypothetical protein